MMSLDQQPKMRLTHGWGQGEVGRSIHDVEISQMFDSVSIGLARFRVIVNSRWCVVIFDNAYLLKMYNYKSILLVLTPALICFITVQSHHLVCSSKNTFAPFTHYL